MASAAMNALRKRRKEEIDAALKELEQSKVEADKNEEVEDELDDHDEEQPSDDKTTDENPVENSEQDDYKRKFERLSGKVSSLEKKANQAEQDAELLRQKLAEANARRALEKERSQTETDDEENEDDWGFDDKEGKPKKKATSAKSKTEINVSEEVNKVLSQKEKENQRNYFIKSLNGKLKSLGEESSFLELINEPSFEKYIRDNRRRSVLFDNSAETQDEESIAIMEELLIGYLGKEKTETKKNTTSPNVRSDNKPSSYKKTNEITEAQYQKALKDKRHASRRAKANEIIQAYHEQQKEK